mgnify:CR=1 FL=1
MTTDLEKYRYRLIPMPYLQYEALHFNFQRGRHQFKFAGIEYDYEVWSSKKDKTETVEASLTFTVHDTISVKYSSSFPNEGYYTCLLNALISPKLIRFLRKIL